MRRYFAKVFMYFSIYIYDIFYQKCWILVFIFGLCNLIVLFLTWSIAKSTQLNMTVWQNKIDFNNSMNIELIFVMFQVFKRFTIKSVLYDIVRVCLRLPQIEKNFKLFFHVTVSTVWKVHKTQLSNSSWNNLICHVGFEILIAPGTAILLTPLQSW